VFLGFLSQQVSLAWRYGACCLLFPVLSTPNQSRQMASLPGSGSAGGLFLLKSSFFLHCCPLHAQDRVLNQREVLIQSVGFLLLWNLSCILCIIWIWLICMLMSLIQLDYNWNTLNWIIFGLNWNLTSKYLKMTFVMNWRYTNKTKWKAK